MAKIRVYLCADATGRTISVRGSARNLIERLEDAGLEVIEEQTDDYDKDYFGTITLFQLNRSDFVPFD